MDISSMPKDEYDFNVVYGALFGLAVTEEYMEVVQIIMVDRRANYVANKAKSAEKACNNLKTVLEREIVKRMSDEQKVIALAAVEAQKQLIYDFFLMDSKDQDRIRGLINKIKKEK